MLEAGWAYAVGVFLLVVGALLPIVDPIGSAPLFLSFTSGSDLATRRALARTVAINSVLLLAGALVLGHYVLRIFGLSVPVVQIGGGLVLCMLAFGMLRDQQGAASQEAVAGNQVAIARAFYPLSFPVTIDPGTISVAITLDVNHPQDPLLAIESAVGALAGVLVVGVSIWLCYYYAERVCTWIGPRRMQAALRLLGFVTLCIGVQIIWNGLRTLLSEVTIRTAGGFGSGVVEISMPIWT